jgi:hypothetical protein
VLKRIGRDEPIWVVIYIQIETTQGISLYSYLYFKLAKHHAFLIIFYVFFFYKIREQEGRTGSVGVREQGWAPVRVGRYPGKGVGG